MGKEGEIMKKSYQKPQIKVTKIKATEKKVRTAKADGRWCC